jgi:hypothetical protein
MFDRTRTLALRSSMRSQSVNIFVLAPHAPRLLEFSSFCFYAESFIQIVCIFLYSNERVPFSMNTLETTNLRG